MPESRNRTVVSCKVDVTGPAVTGSVGVLVMVTPSSAPVRGVSCRLQVMEVRGRLKPDMVTIRVMFSLSLTSRDVPKPAAG